MCVVMAFLFNSLPGDMLATYHLTVADMSSWKKRKEKDFLLVINGEPTSSMVNYLFLNKSVKEERLLQILASLKGVSVSIPIEIENCLIEKFLESHSSMEIGVKPEGLELDMEEFEADARYLGIVKLIPVHNTESLVKLDTLSSTIFYHNNGIMTKSLRGFSKGTNDKLIYYLVSYQGNIVGMCAVCIKGHQACCYCDGILPVYRGKGLATAMLAERLSLLKERGVRNVVVQSVGAISQRVYKKFNFIKKGDIRLYIYNGTI